jgi:SAM-dependent methyltransferase/5-methylcytosine-specific restriction endonuclease McrA
MNLPGTMKHMDSKTLAYYTEKATEIARRYESVVSPVERYFALAFTSGARVLDVGCGSGRDAARLLNSGYDAYGIEPVHALRNAAVAAHPELAGRIGEGGLPLTGDAFGGEFDGILCSAVLMHVPDTDLLEAGLAIRRLLKPGGRLLLSIPASRGDLLSGDRDTNGRLFSPYSADEIALLLERLGFGPISRWESDDVLGRSGTSWTTLLLERRSGAQQRPIDQIESILNRDRKEATYKLALIRALAEIATQEARSAVWSGAGTVGIPIHRIAERWLLYYWPLLAHPDKIPQSRAEAAGGKPIKFRGALSMLMEPFAQQGAYSGLTAWHLARTSNQLDAISHSRLQAALRSIAETIRSGPVAFSGSGLGAGPVFGYDKKSKLVLMPTELWREFSLLGHWIADAVVVRWAALSQQIAHRQDVDAGDILPLLLAKPEPTRSVQLARTAYMEARVSSCTWSKQPLKGTFAVDHAIPFALWGNNDLWNLVPAHPRVNLSKSDKLPAAELLEESKPRIVASWEVLRDRLPEAFDRQAQALAGESLSKAGAWPEKLFSRFREAVEFTALQRGIERWSANGVAVASMNDDIGFDGLCGTCGM